MASASRSWCVESDDRRATLLGFLHQLCEHADGMVVERCEGLIQEQDFRGMLEGAGQSQALAHAARELTHRHIHDARQIDAL